MIDNETLVQNLKRDLDESQGYDSDVLSDKRAKALDYYNGNMALPPKGRSRIVSNDVADTVNALMAQATDIYKGSNVEFPADSEQDETQAQLESDVIKTLMQNNDEYQTFESATFDALLQGNGWIRVDSREEEIESIQKLAQADDMQLLNLEIQLEESGTDYEIRTNEEGEADLIIKVKTRELIFEAVPPENMRFTGQDGTGDIQELTLVAEKKLYKVSDLIELGLTPEQTEEVPDYSAQSEEGDRARAGTYADSTGDTGSAQEAARLKETYLCYYLADMEEDGELQRYKIHLAGDIIVRQERYNYVPYVTGSPMPMPHRVAGLGMYEQMKQVQDTKTGILRAYMDNLAVMNQSRVGYLRGEVDVESLLSGRLNGAVGMDRPDAIFPFPATDIGAQAITGLNYLDQIRTARGGASLDLNNSEMQIASSSATGASAEYNAKEKMASYYCKNLANSLLKQSFLLAHKVLREKIGEPINAKVRGQWVEVNPSDWQPRRRARVVVGLSEREKGKKVQGLSMMIQQIQAWLDQGMEGILTDKERLHRASMDWIRAQEITDHPEEYLIDPTSEQAQQAIQQQAQAQQEQQQAAQQAAMEAEQRAADLQIQLQEMSDKNDVLVKELDTKYKYFDALLNAEMEEAKLTVDTVKELTSAATGESNGSNGKEQNQQNQ